MKRFSAIVGLLFLLGAGKPPIVNAPPPTPPPSHPFPTLPSVWQSIQDPLDRSTGRIVDQPTYELNRMQEDRDVRLRLTVPQSQFQEIESDQERQARIDARDAAIQADIIRARQEAQNRVNRNPSINAGLSPMARQAMADELALSSIVAQRDKALISANEQREVSLRQRPQDRAQIEADYQKQIEAIDRQFQARRAALMGYGNAPATQP